MTYRELLNRYKNNELEESEKTALEQDIEKHEAIGDYLMEQAELPVIELIGAADEDAESGPEEFEKQVKTYIRRAFARTGAIVGAAVLAVLMFVIFALPKIVDGFYYDPGETVGETEFNKTNRMSLDMAVYTELFVPFGYRESVTVDDEGYGNYSVYVRQNVSHTGYFTDVVGKLSRNRLTLYDPNVFKGPTGNAFLGELVGVRDWYSGAGAAGYPKEAFELLDTLESDEKYAAYSTLDKAMSYTEFVEWCAENEEYPEWCALCVKTENGYETVANNLGFLLNGGCCELGYDKDKYPYLSVFDMTEEMEKDSVKDDVMRKHVASLLRYVADNPQFAEMMGRELSPDALRAAADNVEEYGVYIYGFSTADTGEYVQRLKGMEHIAYVYTVPMM